MFYLRLSNSDVFSLRLSYWSDLFLLVVYISRSRLLLL
jgi:hypothetical protein